MGIIFFNGLNNYESFLQSESLPKSTIKFLFACRATGCALSLAISKVPDARRQGVTSEAYKSYSAGRNDRSQCSRWYLDGGSGRRLAHKLDCGFDYGIVPQKTFENTLRKQDMRFAKNCLNNSWKLDK
ncbi:hypothetical protein [Desulfobacula sp.]|uniref:hypothetical protein n=1 Tax=Desulfobacula sp. TaxID=2593537 RepID=UPI001DC28FD6|nr:hypothetical protein [Desulfobacula sp.]